MSASTPKQVESDGRDLRRVADRVEIEGLRAEFSDTVMSQDYDRLVSLFTEDGAIRMPHVDLEAIGHDAIRAVAERLQESWDYFVQTVHPGFVALDGGMASGRTYIAEFGRLRNGGSYQTYGIYHDSYRRTPAGWKFTERLYEVRYVDTSALGGAPPSTTTDARWTFPTQTLR